MDFLGKYVLRGAGFLVAAQIFMTFASTSESLLEKLSLAAKLGFLPIPVLALGAFLSGENGLRAAGFTILLWAGGGATLFLGSVYGGAEDKVPVIAVPQPHEVALGFGFTNLALVVALGIALCVMGFKVEPSAKVYHDIG